MTETATTEVALRDDEPLGVNLIQSLAEEGELCRSAFRVLDPGLTVERYELFLKILGEFKRTCQFAIGDLLNFGEEAFPDDTYHGRYELADELTGLVVGTLHNYASVCSRVAVSRRRDKLPFGHHDAVASLENALQTEWLLAAEEHGWSRTELRDQMRVANVLKPQSRIQWTGGKLGSIAPEIQPPESAPTPDGAAPGRFPAPGGRRPLETAQIASAASLDAAAAVRESAVLLEGGFDPVNPDEPDGAQQPRLVGISLGEDHYIVPRILFDEWAALAAAEE